MKNLVKTGFILLMFATLSIGFASCGGDDTCYECLGNGTNLPDSGTICEGDNNGTGGGVTIAELEATVDAYEALGGTCTKK